MADEEEISVTIEPEAPADGAKPEVVKVNTETQTAVDPVADLKGQYETLQSAAARDRAATEAAQRATQEAEQRAARAEREAAQARGQAAESQYDTIVTGLEGAKSEAEAAEREYKAAYDAGDGTAMAAANRKIARAEAKTIELEGAKSTLEARAKREPEVRKDAPTEAPQRQQVPADPIEAYVSGRTEPTAKWLREHKDYITDPRKNAKLTAAHYNAVGEGLSADTPEYFEHVEKFIGLKKDAPKPNGARRAGSPPVAPVGDAPSGGVNGGGRTVTLTAGEAKAATDGTIVYNYPDPTGKNRWTKGQAIGIQEMARRKIEMTKQGLYDKSYTES